MRWLVVIVVLGLAVPARADDQIWSALLLATNEQPPRETPRALKDLAPSIKKIFGYNSLYVLGQKKRELQAGSDTWLVPSDAFFFEVAGVSQEPAHYQMWLNLYRGKELLLSTEARLARGAPLYIRGPQWGAGQLVLVLEVR